LRFPAHRRGGPELLRLSDSGPEEKSPLLSEVDVQLHFGPHGLKFFFELLTVLMLHTIEQLFDEIMLLAGFLNQLMEMLMILEASEG